MTIIWTIIGLLANDKRIEYNKWRIRRKFINFMLMCDYICVAASLAIGLLNASMFPYLQTISIALLIFLIAINAMDYRKMLLLTMIVTLSPVIVMISTKHPLPLGDDARFSGFVHAILKDGRWIPYKYSENPYYQFFHLVPVMEYFLAVIMLKKDVIASIHGISVYYLTLKLCLYLTYFTLIYMITKLILNDKRAGLFAVLLLSVTPPLSIVQVIHQYYVRILFLMVIYIYLRLSAFKAMLQRYIILFIILTLTGVVGNAVYTLMLMAFFLYLIITNFIQHNFRSNNLL